MQETVVRRAFLRVLICNRLLAALVLSLGSASQLWAAGGLLGPRLDDAAAVLLRCCCSSTLVLNAMLALVPGERAAGQKS